MSARVRIAYSCPFVPAEWIAAHSMEPRRIYPTGQRKPATGGVDGLCSYVGALIQEVSSFSDGEGIVLTTLCDHMRRAAESIARNRSGPLFLLNLPATWGHEGALRLYIDELERLGRFLEDLGGSPAEDSTLIEIMAAYDTSRAKLRAARPLLSGLHFMEASAEFQSTGKLNLAVPGDEAPSPGIPLPILGGPMMGRYLRSVDFIENSGGSIVLDGTDTGERAFPASFDRQSMEANPLKELARAYFDFIPHPFRRPNDMFYRWLERELAARGVRGIIIWRYIWCDLWHGEVARLKEWSTLPVLDLDVSAGDDGSEGSQCRLENRIMAFLEMLQ